MTDRELTQLQETGRLTLANGVNLASILSGLDTLGADPGWVYISSFPGGIIIEVDEP